MFVPPDIDQKLTKINLFANDKITAEDVWRFFTRDNVETFNISVIHELLFAAVKWQYEINQQMPVDDTAAQEEADSLREQVRIDKPRVFQGGAVEKRYFCELALYLKLMYAGSLELEEEEDGPVPCFDRSAELNKQRLPSLPFSCRIVNSSGAKAWTSFLKRLTNAELNNLRGSVGNAVDWNQLNDTFLVDFKGEMFWMPRNSLEPVTPSGSNSQSDAETTPSINDAGRSKTPLRHEDSFPLSFYSPGSGPRSPPGSGVSSGSVPRYPGSIKSSTSVPRSMPALSMETTPRIQSALSRRFRQSIESDEQPQKRVQPRGHRAYHSVNILDTRAINMVIKGSPPAFDDNDVPRTFRAQRRRVEEKQQFAEDVDVYLTDDLNRLRGFFKAYNVSEDEIRQIAGRRIRVEKWDCERQQGQITLGGQYIWLPSQIAIRAVEGREPRDTKSAEPELLGTPHLPESDSGGRVGIRNLRKRMEERPRARSTNTITATFTPRRFDHHTAFQREKSPPIQREKSPPSILVNSTKSNSQPRKTPKQKLSFSNKIATFIPTPGFYYIQRNRQLLIKKCTVHRLDFHRLLPLLGRRVEITAINRDFCGSFEYNARVFLIPMDVLSIDRPLKSFS